MKEILSNGISWLFVPLPDDAECFRVSNGPNHWVTWLHNCESKSDQMKLCDIGPLVDIPPSSWSIFSTLAEVLANEELAKEITVPGTIALVALCELHNIDPTTHWLILKKER